MTTEDHSGIVEAWVQSSVDTDALLEVYAILFHDEECVQSALATIQRITDMLHTTCYRIVSCSNMGLFSPVDNHDHAMRTQQIHQQERHDYWCRILRSLYSCTNYILPILHGIARAYDDILLSLRRAADLYSSTEQTMLSIIERLQLDGGKSLNFNTSKRGLTSIYDTYASIQGMGSGNNNTYFLEKRMHNSTQITETLAEYRKHTLGTQLRNVGYSLAHQWLQQLPNDKYHGYPNGRGNQATTNHEIVISGDILQPFIGLVNRTWALLHLNNNPSQSNAIATWAHRHIPIGTLITGWNLQVEKAKTPQQPIQRIHTIHESLQALDNITDGSVPDSTIAIQQYQRANGKRAWLVLVPGTCNNLHAAINWPSNIPAMSDDNNTRMSASSTALVTTALQRVGAKRNDDIIIVGHSQGGIVAANLASDTEHRYHVSQIITIGSPIANHPIPRTTRVLSVENTGEIVSSLDGNNNPNSKYHVTVKGRYQYANSLPRSYKNSKISSKEIHTQEHDTLNIHGTTVSNIPQSGVIEHDRAMLINTLHDARQLHSSAIEDQEQYFKKTLKGTYHGTQYFSGKLTYNNAHEHK